MLETAAHESDDGNHEPRHLRTWDISRNHHMQCKARCPQLGTPVQMGTSVMLRVSPTLRQWPPPVGPLRSDACTYACAAQGMSGTGAGSVRRTLPGMEVEAAACHTARFTSQLARQPLTNACSSAAPRSQSRPPPADPLPSPDDPSSPDSPPL